MGNSVERVSLKDMGDVIYYKQVKTISDQEMEQSKDLDRELRKGRIIILEKNHNIRGSEDTASYAVVNNNNSLNVGDLKKVLREILPEIKSEPIDIKGAIREIAPMIVDMVRQEISKISITGMVASKPSLVEFQDPVYVPTVSVENMISNVEAHETEVSSAGAEDALAALRRLKSR